MLNNIGEILMNKTFNKSVSESRESLDIIDSHTLKSLIDKRRPDNYRC